MLIEKVIPNQEIFELNNSKNPINIDFKLAKEIETLINKLINVL